MKRERKEENNSVEFMLKEYDRIQGLWTDENRKAEQRVNFFLTLTTATAGILLYIYQSYSSAQQHQKEAIYPAIQIILIILLLFGITILNRLSARTKYWKAYRLSMIEIQNFFASRDLEIASYLQRQKKIIQGSKYRGKLIARIMKILEGGLTEITIVVNGLICSGIAFLGLSNARYSTELIYIGTLIAFSVSILLFHLYSNLIIQILPFWDYY